MVKWLIAPLAAIGLAIAVPAQAQEPVELPEEEVELIPAARDLTFGPRIGPDWRNLEPRFSSEERRAMSYRATHTIVISTLGLVAVVVLLVLLIA
jgi:hypothetical protein